MKLAYNPIIDNYTELYQYLCFLVIFVLRLLWYIFV
jgi:hypothetical protein